MTIEKLQQIFTQYQRQANIDASAEYMPLDHIIRVVLHNQKFGWVIYSNLDNDNADKAISKEIAYFGGLDYAVEWKLFDYDKPSDLGKRLIAQGFSEDEKEAVMILSMADAPDKLRQPISYDIRKATTPKMFADADKVYYEVWKDDPYSDPSPTDMTDWLLPRYQAAPDSLTLHVVYVDDKPVSYGRVEFAKNNPFASIWGGSTLPEYRKRGIYTQLVAARLQEAQERHCQYLTVDARPDTSMPILEKLGFIRIAYATAYNWSPQGT